MRLIIRPPLSREIAILFIALAGFTLWSELRAADTTAGSIALNIAIAALLLLAAVTGFRTSIRADGAGVVARLSWGPTRRLAWAEVHHFALRGGNWHGLGAWTTDGRWVSLATYGALRMKAAQWLLELENYRWERQQQLGLTAQR